MRSKASAKKDVYAEVTDRIVQALEEGTVPWHRPWTAIGGPRNLDGRQYRGINVFLLEITAAASGYTDPRWGTYRMIEAHGGQVRKGEKGTRVILWKPVKAKEDRPDGDERKGYLLLKDYVVFNADQCDGLPEFEHPMILDHERLDLAEAIVAGYPNGPKVTHGGDRAFYSPLMDTVTVPVAGQFETIEAYYSTMFHELVHSTGHEDRLKRLDKATFGSDPYAKEELVAEIGASMLCGMADVQPNVAASASYIASWLRALNDDRTLVVKAAAQAQTASDHILGRKFEEKATAPTEEVPVAV